MPEGLNASVEHLSLLVLVLLVLVLLVPVSLGACVLECWTCRQQQSAALSSWVLPRCCVMLHTGQLACFAMAMGAHVLRCFTSRSTVADWFGAVLWWSLGGSTSALTEINSCQSQQQNNMQLCCSRWIPLAQLITCVLDCTFTFAGRCGFAGADHNRIRRSEQQ